MVGKSKAEQMNERQQELERRLQDVTGQLGSGKKSAKKGMCLCVLIVALINRDVSISNRRFKQSKCTSAQPPIVIQ